jgi:hypothetical protein
MAVIDSELSDHESTLFEGEEDVLRHPEKHEDGRLFRVTSW